MSRWHIPRFSLRVKFQWQLKVDQKTHHKTLQKVKKVKILQSQRIQLCMIMKIWSKVLQHTTVLSVKLTIDNLRR